MPVRIGNLTLCCVLAGALPGVCERAAGQTVINVPPDPAPTSANVGETVRLFPIHEVIAFRSRDKYTEVLTTSGDAVIRKSLKELAEQLEPNTFWQMHRSALVRASAIDRVERDDSGKFRVVLRGCSQSLPVSAAFRSRLRGM